MTSKEDNLASLFSALDSRGKSPGVPGGACQLSPLPFDRFVVGSSLFVGVKCTVEVLLAKIKTSSVLV